MCSRTACPVSVITNIHLIGDQVFYLVASCLDPLGV